MEQLTQAAGDWHDFFIASAGAAAALLGLIFVAVSINLGAILSEEKKIGSPCLTGRALESLVSLLVILAGCLGVRSVTACRSPDHPDTPIRSINAFRKTHIKPVFFSLRLVLAFALVAGYAVAAITLSVQTGLEREPSGLDAF